MNSKVTIVLAILLAGAIGYIVSQMGADTGQNSKASSSNSATTPKPSGASLDLSGQGLTSIPADVLNRTDLTSLNLSNNQLTSLPADIAKLKNLEVLNVENNRLESLPSEIGQLTNLKSADFGNNRLKSLPAELGNLGSIKSINLSGYQGSKSDIEQLKSKLSGTEIKT